jgi:hypothetical protein
VNLEQPLIETLPHPDEVNRSLGTALRQVHLLRRLLKLSETAENYRDCLRHAEAPGKGEPPRAPRPAKGGAA